MVMTSPRVGIPNASREPTGGGKDAPRLNEAVRVRHDVGRLVEMRVEMLVTGQDDGAKGDCGASVAGAVDPAWPRNASAPHVQVEFNAVAGMPLAAQIEIGFWADLGRAVAQGAVHGNGRLPAP